MRVGISSASFYGWQETEEHAARAAALGPDVCEVFLETHSEYSADFGRLVRERLNGVPCVSVHPKGTQFETDLFGQSQRQRADALAIFTRVCEAGQAMGAGFYVMHGPGTANTRRRPEDIRLLLPVMAQMAEIAAGHGLRVLWENVSWCSVRTPEDVLSVRRLLPELGFVLDVKQAWRAGQTPYEILAAMGERICHVHALDLDADGRFILPGTPGGRTDWPQLMRQLRDQGFDGSIILEPYAGQATDDASLRRSMDFLRSVSA